MPETGVPRSLATGVRLDPARLEEAVRTVMDHDGLTQAQVAAQTTLTQSRVTELLKHGQAPVTGPAITLFAWLAWLFPGQVGRLAASGESRSGDHDPAGDPDPVAA